MPNFITAAMGAATWWSDKCRRDDADANAATRGAIDAVLAADCFDADALACLASRHLYPIAVAQLAEMLVCRPRTSNSLAPMLWDHVPLRLARELRAVPSYDDRAPPSNFTEHLRDVAQGKGRRAPGARVTLAALGTPVRPWPAMDRRERAAYLLGLVVRLRRRAVP